MGEALIRRTTLNTCHVSFVIRISTQFKIQDMVIYLEICDVCSVEVGNDVQ